jgi:hypothetical protein
MRFFFLAIICLFLICSIASSEEVSVLLSISQVPDDSLARALDGKNPVLSGSPSDLYVIGMLNPPSFSIQNYNNLLLQDAEGKDIPLFIDESSIYFEFDGDEINSLRIGFVISKEIIENGPPRLSWGDDVSGSNKVVESLDIYREDKSRYRIFDWDEKQAALDSSSHFATVDVIVDDYADTYYIWYLLPMVLVFALLFVRKVMLK